jgi:hypothetical protein
MMAKIILAHDDFEDDHNNNVLADKTRDQQETFNSPSSDGSPVGQRPVEQSMQHAVQVDAQQQSLMWSKVQTHGGRTQGCSRNSVNCLFPL